MEDLHLKIKEETLEKLRSEAEKHGESVATVVRAAIREHLERKEVI